MSTTLQRPRMADLTLVRAMQRLARTGLVHGTIGNLSERRDETIRITRTRSRWDHADLDDLVTVSLTDDLPQIAGPFPSLETPLHRAVYAARPDVGAVVHTHSPHATAWSFLGKDLGPEIEDVGYYRTGPVRTAPHAAAGSTDLAAHAAAVLGQSAAVVLAGHGVLTVGETVDQAIDVAQSVEHHAQICWLLRTDPHQYDLADPTGQPGETATHPSRERVTA